MSKKIKKENITKDEEIEREQKIIKFLKEFEKIKNKYFEEIYLDGEHWQLVMIASDGLTARINLKIEKE